MNLQPFTYQQQSSLADYCRTDVLNPELQVRQERVHHYRRLVFNVVNDSLQSAYPITLKLLDNDVWDQLVHTFFSSHKPQATQIWKMPFEFYEYVLTHPLEIKNQYPHLTDLLLFEWMEVEVFMMEDIPYPAIQNNDIDDDLLNHPLAINPEHRIIKVEYPVHLKKAEAILREDKKDYYILLFREADSGRVQFIDLSALYVLLIENIVKGFSASDILDAIAEQFNANDRESIRENTLTFLKRLQQKGFILGTPA